MWTTDNSGNYVSSAFDVASGTSAALESFETSFQQDLNGDGYIGLVLDGSSGGQTLTAGSSPTTLIGGPNDILNGGAGADTFVFPPNFGANEVNNFRPGTDQLEFSHSTFADVAEVLNNAHQSGSDVVDSTRSARCGDAEQYTACQSARVRFPSHLTRAASYPDAARFSFNAVFVERGDSTADAELHRA